MRAEQFAAHARVEARHWWFTGRREIILRLMAAIARPGAPVADIGCGTGGNAAALAGAGYRVLGIDPAAEAIALARRRFPAIAFEAGDDPSRARGHLADGGVLLMTDVLEHVEDDRRLLASAVGAVPVGGHLLLTVPADPSLWSAHDVAFGHFRRYQAETFAPLWADQPVTVRLLSAFNARLRPLIALHRRWRGNREAPGGDLDVPTGPLNSVLHRVFAGEATALVAAIDRDRAPWKRGVSLVAVLRRT